MGVWLRSCRGLLTTRPLQPFAGYSGRPRTQGLHTSHNTKSTDMPYKTDQHTFLEDLTRRLLSYLQRPLKDDKVIEFVHPAELQDLLQLEVGKPADSAAMLDLCDKVIRYSVHTDHPHFFNQLYSGRDLYGLGGSWLIETLNTNQHTFEVAPVFVLIEQYIIKKINEFTGYTDGDGVFAPGGSFANVMALHLARCSKLPGSRTAGMTGQPPATVFCSDEAHYSVTKGASFVGLGSDNVVKIETDARGVMLPEKLEEAVRSSVKQGQRPMLVWATSGSTVLGSYDDINALADVCEQHDMWLHVDGAWGGGVMLSDKHKHLVAGLHRSDSYLWNTHKMTNTPLQCTALLVKEKGLLEKFNASNAAYLFQPDKFYDTSYDKAGDKTVQCGRKADATKLWVMWRAHGDQGMAAMVDQAFDNAHYLQEKIRATEGFRLVIPEHQCANICFWYIPPSMRGQQETAEWWRKLGTIAPIIKERMTMQGTMLIGYNPLHTKGFVNFFRVVVQNQSCDHTDMDFIVNEIDRLGKDL